MSGPGFIPFPKIARLNRDIVITEKIDVTNGVVYIPDAVEQSMFGCASKATFKVTIVGDEKPKGGDA